MNEEHELAIAFGLVGLLGWALFVLGILKRSRLVAAVGLGAVVADVTVAELGGFKAKEPDAIVEPTQRKARK